MTDIGAADAAVRRWFGALLIVGAAFAVVGVPTSTGFVIALILLAFALALFATTRDARGPFERLARARRR